MVLVQQVAMVQINFFFLDEYFLCACCTKIFQNEDEQYEHFMNEHFSYIKCDICNGNFFITEKHICLNIF